MDITEVKSIWEDVKAELKQTVPAHAYDNWFLPLEATGYDNDIFSLLTVHQLAVDIIRKTHYAQIKSALEKVLGKETEFVINYDADLADKYRKEKQKAEKNKKISSDTNTSKTLDNLAQMQSFSNLNLKYKFENFVVGENSRFAQAAAIAVAKNPAKKYNPLFIYGASGLGKTHLMQAIGHYILFNKPKLKVKYIKTEEYFNELIKNLQTGGSDKTDRMDKFRQKYRNVDVLLIDDIQFLESKTHTMDEIFHTFDSLHNNNKQIVITSDRLPKDIPTLPDRLRTRFEMGLVVDITPPDFETRVAILANLAEQINMRVEFAVFEYIAHNFTNNVRELEGAFNKVSAYADIEGVTLDLEYAKKVLKCDEIKKNITLDIVAQETARFYHVTVEDFKSSSRNQKVSTSRQIAVYLSRELTGKSFEAIAEFFNKKHTTMLYSYQKIKDDLKINKNLNSDITEITKKIKG